MTGLLAIVRRSPLLRSTGIYGVGGAVGGALAFLLVPILTRTLDKEAYGLVAMFQVVSIFAFHFVGSHAAAARRQFEEDRDGIPAFLSTSTAILLVNTAILAAALYLFREPIVRLTGVPEAWLWCPVVLAGGRALAEMYLTMARVRFRALEASLFQVAQSLAVFLLVTFAVAGLEAGWTGAVVAEALAFLCSGLLAVLLLFRAQDLRWEVDRSAVKGILAYNLPLVAHLAGRSVMTLSDRVFVTRMEGISETGLYVAGSQIGMGILWATKSFNVAWVPDLFSRLRRQDAAENRKIVRRTYGYFGIVLLGALSMGLVSGPLCRIVLGSAFAAASPYVFWVALGYAFNGMYWMVAPYVSYVRKNHLIAGVTLLAAALNLVLNYVLIRANGPVGAAQATAVTFFVAFLLTFTLAARVHPMPWLKGIGAARESTP